jgi:hypothetical protein
MEADTAKVSPGETGKRKHQLTRKYNFPLNDPDIRLSLVGKRRCGAQRRSLPEPIRKSPRLGEKRQYF